MNAKVMYSGGPLEAAIASVIDDLSFCSRVTMGPAGKTVVIGKSHGDPHITKDGATAIKALGYADNARKTIYDLIKKCIVEANDEAGDGSTTCTVLLCEVMRRFLRCKASGMDASKLKLGLDAARVAFVKHLESISKPVSGKRDIYDVARISSDGDEDLSQIMSDVMEKVGKHGVITIEEGKTVNKVDYELTTGMSLNQGFTSPHFTNSKSNNKAVVEFENPYILLVKDKIGSLQQIVPILEAAMQSGRPLLIVADDFDTTVLSLMVFNKLHAGLKVCAVKAPGFGERKADKLSDIGIITGTVPFSADTGAKLEGVTLETLGTAKKVLVTSDKTIIYGGSADQSDIDDRVESIRRMIEESSSDYDKEKLRERIAGLAGGVVVIRVGGQTDAEVKERKDRYEDALNATRAATEEGIVVGGGLALYSAKKALQAIKMDDDVAQTGVDIVIGALSACLECVVGNAGYSGAVVANKLDDMNSGGNCRYVFDVRTGNYVDAFENGIVDPAKVVRVAVEKAIDAAGLLLRSSILITDKDEEEDNSSGGGARNKKSGMGSGGGGYGDMDF